MANSKNTIQRIPLNGTLNMNTLKTDVKQFEGFNEKNSTVFGGTLSPFFDKTTTLGNEDNSYTIFNSKGVPYTLTSNGSVFQLVKNGEVVFDGKILSTKTETLDVPDDTVSAATDLDGNPIYVTKSGTVKWMGGTASLSTSSEVLSARIWVQPAVTYIAAVTANTDHILVVRDGSLVVNKAFNHTSPIPLTYSPLITGSNTLANDNSPFGICVLTNSGKLEVKIGNVRNFETYAYEIDSSNNINKVDSDWYYLERLSSEFAVKDRFYDTPATYECYQFANRKLFKEKGAYLINDIISEKVTGAINGYLPCPVGQSYSFKGSAYYLNGSLISIGHMGTPIAPCLSFGDNTVNTIHVSGNPLHIFYHGIDGKWYHYQPVSAEDTDDKNEWLKSLVFDGRYIFLRSDISNKTRIYDIETDKLIDNVAFDWILDSTPWVKKSDLTTVEKYGYYDFENEIILTVNRPNNSNKVNIDIHQTEVDPDFDHLYTINGMVGQDTAFQADLKIAKGSKDGADVDWNNVTTAEDVTITIKSVSDVDYFASFSATIPLGGYVIKTSSWSRKREGKERVYDTTGCVFGGGYNAGYAISNSPFVGYLPNPYVVSNFPKSTSVVNYPTVPKGVQFYCTVGDQSMSAEYVGGDSRFIGTTLAIDSSGNVILPVSSNGKIISGYSNNDLVRENGTSYPLMYWNNSQKIYAYFLLSGIENMTGVFSLQGQQYTVDDNNIYAVSFSNGIVQNVQVVCYKKNLQFLGTLPSQAIFWSAFNKTFYSFTGDRLVSKMFEASDIGEVRYVGQNPASLSLWICTDKGTYILSDTDAYRLNYICEEVVFIKNSAMVITPEDDGKRRVHQISLWNIGNGGEMIPVKLKTAYFGLGVEQKSVMDCWYIRLFDENRVEGEVKVKVNTITDITRHSEEKTFKINPSDYDENNIVYLRYQPKYQECTSMQLELESNIGIYELAIGVNATDSTAQVSKLNF